MLRTWFLAFTAGTCMLLGGAVVAFNYGPRPPAAPALQGFHAGSEPLERIDLLEAVRNARIPRVGEAAADFEAKDEVGAPFQLAAHRDRPLLLGAFCTCAVCRDTATRWMALLQRHPREFGAAALVALPKGDALFDFHDSLRINFPLIPDPDHSLSARYPGEGTGSAALGCPRAWVIGTDGRYRYVLPMGARPGAAVMEAISRALGLRDADLIPR